MGERSQETLILEERRLEQEVEVLPFHLVRRLETEENRRIRWAPEVVDNEFLNKKSSKKCCIFHKKKAYYESSSESEEEQGEDSDSSESEGGPSSCCGKESHCSSH